MGSCFKPLRRKMGVGMLLIACVFMGGWARSTGIVDLITVPGQSTNYVFVSGGQKWRLLQTGFFGYAVAYSQRGNGSVEREIKIEISGEFERIDPLWISEIAPRVGIFDSHVDRNNPVVQMIPYWSIVIPMTLLSAWLLLSKPRQKSATR